MSRYFFHLDETMPLPDAVGTELANADDARREAVRFAAETMRLAEPSVFQQPEPFRARVTDEGARR